MVLPPDAHKAFVLLFDFSLLFLLIARYSFFLGRLRPFSLWNLAILVRIRPFYSPIALFLQFLRPMRYVVFALLFLFPGLVYSCDLLRVFAPRSF